MVLCDQGESIQNIDSYKHLYENVICKYLLVSTYHLETFENLLEIKTSDNVKIVSWPL